MQDNDTLKSGDTVSTWKVIALGFTHSDFKIENTFRIANAKNASNPTESLPYHFREAGGIKIMPKSMIYHIKNIVHGKRSVFSFLSHSLSQLL